MLQLFSRASRTACVLAVAIAGSTASARPGSDVEGAQFPSRVLAAHNAARAAAGVPFLAWDDQLGTDAARYSLQLALSDIFDHSSPEARRGAGENLWMGTRGAFQVNAMVGAWVSEARMFNTGVFPTVSRTGNWQDIGHYTQIVWPTTQRVGCALATNARNDYLVCRYWPAGNVQGVAIRPASVELARRR